MKAQIVSFHCVLKDRLGQVLSSSFNQDVINQLENRKPTDGFRRLQGLVAGLQNVQEGEKRHFIVPAEQAFGPYDPKLVLTIPRAELEKGSHLVIGSEVVTPFGPGGTKQVYRVIQTVGESLVLDGNHPFAGQDLVFDIEIVSARDACSEDFEEPYVSDMSQYRH